MLPACNSMACLLCRLFLGSWGPVTHVVSQERTGARNRKLLFAVHLPGPGLGDLVLSKSWVALLSPPKEGGPDTPSHQWM